MIDGKFTKSQDDVGRSLAAGRRKKARKRVKNGEGERGPRTSGWTPLPNRREIGTISGCGT